MGLAGYGSLGQHVSVCDRLNTLNPLVNETEIVSMKVTVLCSLVKILCLLVRTQFERLVRGTYASYSQGNPEWKARLVSKGHKQKEVDALGWRK